MKCTDTELNHSSHPVSVIFSCSTNLRSTLLGAARITKTPGGDLSKAISASSEAKAQVPFPSRVQPTCTQDALSLATLKYAPTGQQPSQILNLTQRPQAGQAGSLLSSLHDIFLELKETQPRAPRSERGETGARELRFYRSHLIKNDGPAAVSHQKLVCFVAVLHAQESVRPGAQNYRRQREFFFQGCHFARTYGRPRTVPAGLAPCLARMNARGGRRQPKQKSALTACDLWRAEGAHGKENAVGWAGPGVCGQTPPPKTTPPPSLGCASGGDGKGQTRKRCLFGVVFVARS